MKVNPVNPMFGKERVKFQANMKHLFVMFEPCALGLKASALLQPDSINNLAE